MNYVIHEVKTSLIDTVLDINNLKYEDIDVSNFQCDYNNAVLNSFKEGIENNKNKKFLIVGDYDCDGICATTIILRLLSKLNIKANFYIPSRSLEGYGLNNSIVEKAISNNFECVFMVDNGVKCFEQLNLLRQANIKTFVLDHHEYEGEVNCDYLLHPSLLDKEYSDMCAGGLSALLANSYDYDELSLCYGGLATLADMVSVLGYNRYLLKEMLYILRKGNIHSINYLLGKNEYTYENISFNVIPKINAVSRLDEYLNVNHIVEYLLADNNSCANFYHKIDNINNMRKDYSNKMYEELIDKVNKDDNFIICISEENKEGLCGLVANRLLNIFNKPVMVLCKKDNEYRGSARSPKDVDIYSYLKDLDIFTAFGGHNQAVGLSISFDNFVKLKEYIKNNQIEYKESVCDVISINEGLLNNDTLIQIESLKPFGTNFKEPLLLLKDVKYQSKFVIKNKYPKFTINDNCSAISFNESLANKEFASMIGKLEADNYYRGKLSFKIEDLI